MFAEYSAHAAGYRKILSVPYVSTATKRPPYFVGGLYCNNRIDNSGAGRTRRVRQLRQLLPGVSLRFQRRLLKLFP